MTDTGELAVTHNSAQSRSLGLWMVTIFVQALKTAPHLAAAVAIGVLWLLTSVNMAGVRNAGLIQLVTTVLKLIPLVAIALVGLFFFNAVPIHLRSHFEARCARGRHGDFQSTRDGADHDELHEKHGRRVHVHHSARHVDDALSLCHKHHGGADDPHQGP